MDWLSNLEEKVHAAAARLHTVHEENRALRARVAELEKQLAAASSADPQENRWDDEKREIRQRVEQLTRTLEELVEP